MAYDDYGNWVDDSYNPWIDVVNNAIWAGQSAAQVAEAGYPPGSNVYYSPTTSIGYPQTQVQPHPATTYPTGYPTVTPQVSPAGSLQLSNTTLMLIVGGVLLFILGSKRGR